MTHITNPENVTPGPDDEKIVVNPAHDPAQAEDMDAGAARPVTASELVSDDTDSPKADNRLQPSINLDRPDDPENGDVPESTQGNAKGRGRPKLDAAEKEKRKLLRIKAKLEGKPPPDFSDITGPARPVAGIGNVPLGPKPRDYTKEALGYFVPASLAAGKILGDHFSIKFNGDTKQLELTTEQLAYVQSFAEWLEYEQFGELNKRYQFLFHSVMYIGPKLQTEPTPERLKGLWGKIVEKFSGMFGKKKKEKRVEKKEDKETHSPE